MLGIVLLLTDFHLAARLVVALSSLRRWYDGPVTLFTTKPESHRIGQAIENDARLRVEHRTAAHIASTNRYTSAYLAKSSLIGSSPYDATVYLDADTLTVGPLDELLESTQSGVVTVTPYGPWSTTNDQFRKRLAEWEQLVQEEASAARWASLVHEAGQVSHPWVNTGVFGMLRNNPLIEEWRELTSAGSALTIPEEMAFQFVFCSHPYQLLGSHFNCLPQFEPHPPDVRIWHFAGESHLKHEAGRRLWLPAFEACHADNLANMREWSRLTPPRDAS